MGRILKEGPNSSTSMIMFSFFGRTMSVRMKPCPPWRCQVVAMNTYIGLLGELYSEAVKKKNQILGLLGQAHGGCSMLQHVLNPRPFEPATCSY